MKKPGIKVQDLNSLSALEAWTVSQAGKPGRGAVQLTQGEDFQLLGYDLTCQNLALTLAPGFLQSFAAVGDAPEVEHKNIY